ncbi:MAG: hypothetical protein GY946_32235, partial [bacterium]|nr:hypothetical protein [bacterium]
HIPDNGESLLGAEFDYYTTQYNSSDVTPGSGLFIWRIDEEMLRLTFDFDINLINAYNDHYGVMLLEADGYPDLSIAGNYDENAYGGDYDAFRDAGGPNDLVETATSTDANSLPSTRTAEGADSGWRFHSVSAHGPSMSFTARWEALGFPRNEEIIAGRLPVGDPLAADVIGDAALEFVYLTTDGDSLFVHVAPSGDFAAASVIARIEGQAAGSIAAEELDNLTVWRRAEIVLLTTDGRLFAWRGDGTNMSGTPGEPIATVNAASRTPLLYRATYVGSDDLIGVFMHAILVLEELPDEGLGYCRCTPRWFLGDGTQWNSSPFGTPHRGLPIADPAASLIVAAPGYDHEEAIHALFNICLFDSSEGGSQSILQLAP